MHLPRCLLTAALWLTCLTLSHAQPLPRPPVIVEDPKSLIVAVGQEARLTVNVLPGVLKTTYQWQLRGSNLADATNATLILSNTQFTHAGPYQVLVANGSGQRLSAEAQLVVVGVEDQSVSRGATAQFTMRTAGLSGEREILWRYQGRELASGPSNILRLTNVTQLTHAGLYEAEIRSSIGFARVEPRLEVDEAFTKITTGSLATETGNAAGASWGDYDGDGFLDLVVGQESATGNANNRVYRNDGNGSFTRHNTAPFNRDPADARGVIWADYDNSGTLDLLITAPSPRSYLYLNAGDGRFLNTGTTILNLSGDARGASWLDYDADGLLDLFVPFGENRNLRLYRNTLANGTNTFVRQTGLPFDSERGYFTGSSWADYDNDGRPDLFVTSFERTGNLLYRNLGGGRFEKVTTGPVATNRADSVGAAWGDYDNDGYFDLFVANGPTDQEQDNHLYRNNGDGTFTQITSEVRGTPVSDGGESPDCAWADYDNDGFLDLFVVNAGQNGGLLNGKPRKNFLYLNDGDGTFTKILTGSLANDPASHSCTWGDYDNDGFLDLFAGNNDAAPYLYRNNGNSNGWLKVKPVGTISNRSAIGARVKALVTIRGRTMWQMREVNGGNGYRSQNGLLPHFGLGDATNIQTLRIEWPSGIVQEYSDVAPRQALTITEVAVTAVASAASVLPGEAVTFRYEGPTNGVTLQWTLNGTNIVGATGATLEVAAASLADVGEYRVVATLADATGAGGTLTASSRPVRFDLAGKPVVGSLRLAGFVQPSVSVGESIRILSTVSGAPPFTYQWQFNGVDIPTNTNPSAARQSIIITNANPAAAGNYRLKVRNASGETVGPALEVTVDSRFTRILTGDLASSTIETITGNWVDYDNDGWLDLWAVGGWNDGNLRGSTTAQLYRNDGTGRLVLQATNLLSRQSFTIWTGQWADFDNDGDVDVWQAGHDSVAANLFVNEGAGRFVRMAANRNLVPNARATINGSIGAWVDFDSDGLVDFMATHFSAAGVSTTPDTLLFNQGDGTFSAVTNSPISLLGTSEEGVCFVDLDGDGYLDLFTGESEEGGRCRVWLGDPRGGFVPQPDHPLALSGEFYVGQVFADIDNDGDPDLFLLSELHGRLGINEGSGQFRWVLSREIGIITVGYGYPVFADLDNDADLDLLITQVVAGNPAQIKRSRIFLNDGAGRFEEVLTGTPVSIEPGGQSYQPSAGDFTGDGYPDLFVGGAVNLAPKVYVNRHREVFAEQGKTNHWLVLRLKGLVSNGSGIGARVYVTARVGGREVLQFRQVAGQMQWPNLEVHFGLGDATMADLIRIEWPSGIVQEQRDVAVDRNLTIEEEFKGPLLSRPTARADGESEFSLVGRRGKSYRVEATGDFLRWDPVRTVAITNATRVWLTVPVGSGGTARFYRAVEE